MNHSNKSIQILIKMLSRISPKTFRIAVECSKVYRRANNKNAAIRVLRYYENHNSIKIHVAKELFKNGAFYKVLGLFSEKSASKIRDEYGMSIVEMIGDCYFSNRRFDIALEYYEFIINNVKGAKTSRIKLAECHYHNGYYNKSIMRLEQYVTRFGETKRSKMLYERLVINNKVKGYRYKEMLQNKYGIDIHYKLEMI